MEAQSSVCTLNNGNMRISVPLRIKYKRGRKRIIVPEALDGENPESESPVQSSLVHTLVRAHAWMKAFESGEVLHVRHLAEKLNLDSSHVGRILRLVNLAPDIQEAILNGTEPDGMSFTRLAAGFPEDWQEQRELFKT